MKLRWTFKSAAATTTDGVVSIDLPSNAVPVGQPHITGPHDPTMFVDYWESEEIL